VPRGGGSRAIDLRGAGTRSLRKMAFRYDSQGIPGGQADVTVVGVK
jgi:hypothetical protein